MRLRRGSRIEIQVACSQSLGRSLTQRVNYTYIYIYIELICLTAFLIDKSLSLFVSRRFASLLMLPSYVYTYIYLHMRLVTQLTLAPTHHHSDVSGSLYRAQRMIQLIIKNHVLLESFSHRSPSSLLSHTP